MLTDKVICKGRLDQIIKKRYVKNVCLLVAGQHIRPPEEQGEQVQPVREEKGYSLFIEGYSLYS